MTHRDPTCEAVERLEEQGCEGCPWRQWNPFNRLAWCEHPKWIGREAERPSSKPIGPLGPVTSTLTTTLASERSTTVNSAVPSADRPTAFQSATALRATASSAASPDGATWSNRGRRALP